MISDEHECSTAREFLDFFRNDLFRPRHIYAAHFWGLNGYIFRGQPDSSWKLCPSCFRDNRLQDFTPQAPGILADDPRALKRYLGSHMHAELRAVFLFMETADKLGIQTPLDYSNIGQYTELITAALNAKEADYEESFPAVSTLNEMALAQHHGVPTRLLDWTESPLVAAFFAAYQASTVEPKYTRVSSERIAVFYIHTNQLREEKSPLVVVNTPRHGNTFLRVQKGLFTHMPQANSFFLRNRRWPTINDMLVDNPDLGIRIRCVSLPTSEATELLRLLFLQDVTKYSVMPSLDNVASAFKYRKALFGRDAIT